MSTHLTYFTIPFDKVPPKPSFTVWFATWTSVRPRLNLEQPRPFVVGVVQGDLPDGAVLLGSGRRSSPPPPPPPTSVAMSDYQKSIQQWLTTGSDAQMYTYFAIPFDDLPVQSPYISWFASWSPTAPVVEDVTCLPLVVGVVKGTDIPRDATFLASSDTKDPTAPPPPAVAPGTNMANYTRWLQERRMPQL